MQDREKTWGKANTLVKLIMFSDFYCGSEKKKINKNLPLCDIPNRPTKFEIP